MRRTLASALAVAAVGVFALLASGLSGGGGGNPTYWVELDNAFGLTTGGDAKIAGVRAGKITALKVCTARDVRSGRCSRVNRALAQIQITQAGWGSLRRDVTCETRPQSLIADYFIDCLPGTSPQALKPGSTIPVAQTSSTIPPDLVNDIMRQPYRQRLTILVDELGAAVGGNSNNLNQAIRRAVPALREIDRVLAILATQNRTLADLATNGDKVISALAANRRDVGRWVVQAGNAAAASADRRAALAAGFRKLPGFLEQLRPAMVQLGSVADQQTPALRDLNASARQLDLLVRNLRPFAEASQPAFTAFGRAAQTGRSAVQAATPTIQLLNQFAQGTPELGQNLALTLEHLDNRKYAVEADPRSPGGQGWTGLEDLLNYVFWQSTSVNIFDQSEHLLNTSNFVPPECHSVEDAKDLLANPQLFKDCTNRLGPNVPGINAPDPSAAGKGPTAAHALRPGRPVSGSRNATGDGGQETAGGGGRGGGSAGGGSGSLGLPSLKDILPGAGGAGGGVAGTGIRVPSAPSLPGPGGAVGQGASGTSGPMGTGSVDPRAGHLLDYLMGP